MAAGLADEFVARLAVQADADLVGHGAGGHKQCGFFAEDFGGELLQAVAGGIDVDDVVTDVGIGDRLAHFGRGAGDGVGAEVDRSHEGSGFRVRGSGFNSRGQSQTTKLQLSKGVESLL